MQVIWKLYEYESIGTISHSLWDLTHSAKIDLNKKLDPKKKTIQTFNIDAQRFRKTKNENPPTWEIGVAC